MVKLGFFIASVLLLISCSSGFPSAPKMEFCILEEDGTITMCKSIHVFSKSDCDNVGGRIIPEGEDIPAICTKKD